MDITCHSDIAKAKRFYFRDALELSRKCLHTWHIPTPAVYNTEAPHVICYRVQRNDGSGLSYEMFVYDDRITKRKDGPDKKLAKQFATREEAISAAQKCNLVPTAATPVTPIFNHGRSNSYGHWL